MRIFHAAAILAALSALPGCASRALSGSDASDIDSSPGIDVSRLDVEGKADFLAAYQFVLGQDATTNMPNSGSADFLGGFGADVAGDIDGFMTGSVELSIDDLDNGTVTGSLDELALYNTDGTLNRDFAGEIFLNGVVNDTAISAAGVDNVRDNTTNLETDVAATLNGVFRDLSGEGRASAATGTVDGDGRGDFDFVMSDGLFYAVEQ